MNFQQTLLLSCSSSCLTGEVREDAVFFESRRKQRRGTVVEVQVHRCTNVLIDKPLMPSILVILCVVCVCRVVASALGLLFSWHLVSLFSPFTKSLLFPNRKQAQVKTAKTNILWTRKQQHTHTE